jgi:hypothetical protein
MESATPVWLLDVDGVINAATLKPDPNVWPHDQWTRATVARLKILVARPVLDFIRATHESGAAEIRWLTTWMNDAQAIADEFGLPTFPVEGGPEYDDRLRERAFDRDAWWKLPAATRVLVEEKRPLIWTDDDITYSLGRRGQDEMRALGPALLIGPNERTGLTPKHLRRIGDFLAIHAPGPTTSTIERSTS